MPRNKLKQILSLPSLDNVINNPYKYKSEWHIGYFHNSNPITLELGCGRGDYVLQLAQKYPQRNFLGIDLKGARLFMGATRALTMGLENIGFIQLNIFQIADIFGKNEINDIWITFPDPFPKPARASKRLTSSRFLNLYRQILKKDGIIQFKTDDNDLYKFTLESLEKEKCTILANHIDLYAQESLKEIQLFKTTYEKRHLKKGKTTKYVEFQL